MSSGTSKALDLLRRLPRVCMSNIQPNPGSSKRSKRTRGLQGGKMHGCGHKGAGQHQRYSPAGYENGNMPFYMKIPARNMNSDRYCLAYIPLTLKKLQLMVDTGRLRTEIPIDVTQLMLTGLFRMNIELKNAGFMLEEEGIDCLNSPMNLEVQYASEAAISAIERAGGTITTAYYDPVCLTVAIDPKKHFAEGIPLPRRMLPPQSLIGYYTDPKNRGYLADPDAIAEDRLVLAQKYGYVLPDVSASPCGTVLQERKDPRQVFFGLEPGWVVSLTDKVIQKPTAPELMEFYAS